MKQSLVWLRRCKARANVVFVLRNHLADVVFVVLILWSIGTLSINQGPGETHNSGKTRRATWSAIRQCVPRNRGPLHGLASLVFRYVSWASLPIQNLLVQDSLHGSPLVAGRYLGSSEGATCHRPERYLRILAWKRNPPRRAEEQD